MFAQVGGRTLKGQILFSAPVLLCSSPLSEIVIAIDIRYFYAIMNIRKSQQNIFFTFNYDFRPYTARFDRDFRSAAIKEVLPVLQAHDCVVQQRIHLQAG